MIHELKTDPQPFAAVSLNHKRFEIRKDDRPFNIGDELLLLETTKARTEVPLTEDMTFSGRKCRRIVTHIMRGPCYGLQDGWALLSVRPLTSVEKVPA